MAPPLLTGDTTKRLAIDNDAPIEGVLDLAAGTVSLHIVAAGNGDSVDATFVGQLAAAPIDTDGDGVFDSIDNCPELYNPDQVDDPPEFVDVTDLVITRCSPGDEATFPPPTAIDLCTPDEVDIEGTVIAIDGEPLDELVNLDDLMEYFPSGTIDVEWTATDGNDNSSSVVQKVELATVPTLFATRELRLNDRADIIAADGFFGTAFNSGDTWTEIGVESDLGDLFSTAPVFLRERANIHGTLKALTEPMTQIEFTIGSALIPYEPFFPEVPSLNAIFPWGPDVVIEPESSPEPRAPGAYGWVKVERDSTLVLSSGIYEIRFLQLEPGSTVVLDKASGPIEINVEENAMLRGEFVPTDGDFSGFLLGYAGPNEVFLDRPFSGRVVAPNGKLKLSTVGSPGTFRGLFSARDIEVMPDTVVEHIPYDCMQTIVVD